MAMTYANIPYNDAFSRQFEHQMMLPNEYIRQALANQKLKQDAQDEAKMNQAKIGNLNTLSQFRMSPSGQLRNLSPLGKSYLEPKVLGQLTGNPNFLNNGVQPENDNQGTPGDPVSDENEIPNSINDQYEAVRQKLTSDQKTREKSLYAANIEKTLGRVNPKIFEVYSGPEGALKLGIDSAKALKGETTPEYREYTKFIHGQLPIVVGQIRQFFGDSIQPELREELKNIVNPINWQRNPELAMAQWEEINSLLKSEMQTYKGALNSPIRDAKSIIPSSNSYSQIPNHITNDQLFEIANRRS